MYHHFEDKQALVRAVIEYQADAVLDIQGANLDRLDTMDGLRAWRDFLVERQHQRRRGCRGGCPIGAWAPRWPRPTPRPPRGGRGLRGWEGRIRDGFGPCTRAAAFPRRPTPRTSR